MQRRILFAVIAGCVLLGAGIGISRGLSGSDDAVAGVPEPAPPKLEAKPEPKAEAPKTEPEEPKPEVKAEEPKPAEPKPVEKKPTVRPRPRPTPPKPPPSETNPFKKSK